MCKLETHHGELGFILYISIYAALPFTIPFFGNRVVCYVFNTLCTCMFLDCFLVGDLGLFLQFADSQESLIQLYLHRLLTANAFRRPCPKEVSEVGISVTSKLNWQLMLKRLH